MSLQHSYPGICVDKTQIDTSDLLQRLRYSEYRYSSLFNATAACFWELDFRAVGAILRRVMRKGVTELSEYFEDPDNIRGLLRATKVIDCNRRAVELFGRGSKDELMTTIEPFWPEKSFPVYAGSLLAYLENRPSFSAETTLHSIDGQSRDVLFTACYPDKLSPEGSMLIGIVDLADTKRALHEARQANIRADTLAEAQAFAFWQLDSTGTNAMLADLRAQGVTDLGAYMDEHPEFVEAALEATIVLDANQKAVDLYGLRDKSEAIGKGCLRYWPPGRYEAFKGSIEAGFNGQSHFQKVTRTKTVDGRELDCRFWMASPPEMRANGTIMVAIQDLTDEIAARREVEQLREGLAHAGRVLMLGEFAASIAHEINQPLAAIRAASSAAGRWLAMTPPDLEQAATSLANIAQSARRAGDIIDRIRGMVVKRPPERSAVDVRSLVDQAVDFVSRELHAYQTVPMIDIPRDLPKILVDRTQIQQVLVNLIVNALQAMDQGQTPLRSITVSAAVEDRNCVAFSVRDTGPGLDPRHVDRLFDHFFSTKEGGMGIGLTICQSIVQAHDGRIAAGNAASGGAEFRFTVSRADRSDPVYENAGKP